MQSQSRLTCIVAFFSPTVCHVERGHVLRESSSPLSTMARFPASSSPPSQAEVASALSQEQ